MVGVAKVITVNPKNMNNIPRIMNSEILLGIWFGFKGCLNLRENGDILPGCPGGAYAGAGPGGGAAGGGL